MSLMSRPEREAPESAMMAARLGRAQQMARLHAFENGEEVDFITHQDMKFTFKFSADEYFKPRDPIKVAFDRETVFLNAAAEGDDELVTKLLADGVDINTRNHDGLTALHIACNENNLKIAALLLTSGADVNARDAELWTPLHACSSCGYWRLVNLLLTHGADVAAVNADGELAVDTADDTRVVELLERSMEEIGLDAAKKEALRQGMEENLIAQVQKLLDEGRSVDKRDTHHGGTALHVAACNDWTRAAAFLLDHNADADAQDNDGNTPLHLAAFFQSYKIIELLDKRGANVNIVNRCKQPPTVVSEDVIVIRMLCNMKKKQGESSVQSPESTAAAPAKPDDRSLDQKLQDAVEALAEGHGVKNLRSTLVLIGGGGTGKTSLLKSLQGLDFDAQLVSTCGGDKLNLLFELSQDNFAGLQKPSCEFSRTEQAVVMHALQGGQALATASINSFAVGAHSYCGLVQIETEEVEKQVEIKGSNLATVASKTKGKEDQERAKLLQKKQKKTPKGQAAKAAGSALPAAAPNPNAKKKHTEKIHFKRGSGELLLSNMEDNEMNALKLTIFDMGGQPEFFSLASMFLRNHAISLVFSRLDHLLADFSKGSSKASETTSDSNMKALSELTVWLDAVVSGTDQGAVMLVFTYADVVKDLQQHQQVSQALEAVLQRKRHPVLERLVRRADGLLFYPVDNTRSIADPGVRQLKEDLQKTAENSSGAKQLVPLGLRMLEDVVTSLARPPADLTEKQKRLLGDTVLDAIAQVRQQANSEAQGLPIISIAQLAFLYTACTQSPLENELKDPAFRAFVDFLHLQGIITHFNSPSLDKLVVIDPSWLLESIAAIIRRPDLHPRAGDGKLCDSSEWKNLYSEGKLSPEFVDELLPDRTPEERLSIIRIMTMTQLCLPWTFADDSTGFLVPSLLPLTLPTLPAPDVERSVFIAPHAGRWKNSVLSQKEFSQRGHIPVGLFAQLVALLGQLSQAQALPLFHLTSRALLLTFFWGNPRCFFWSEQTSTALKSGF
eukprot:m.268707 g.268707  ORF g.268707 m.268707 type:complete len:1014 (-) comp22814_c0_seq2:1348-4389(-)